MRTQKPPLCPECGSEKVGFSDTNELKCQCGHLFEPPENMKGRAPSEAEKQWKQRELKIESSPPPSRQKKESWENQLYWLIDDIIVEATAAGGQCFPKRYNEWEDYHPGGSLEWWIESEVETNDSLSFDVERIQQNLTEYLRSTEPNEILELIADHQRCWDNILRGHDFIKRKSVRYLSLALVKMFPLERVFKIHTKDCRSFTLRRQQYKITAKHGKAIKLLIERAKEGHPNVPDADILVVMGREPTSRVRNGFKHSVLWGTKSKPSLIVSKKRGCRCLALYPKNFEIPI